MKNVTTNLDASRIEQLISSKSKDIKFRFSSSIPDDKSKVSDEWILTKTLHGKKSELTIRLCDENYIHVCSWTDDWNLLAYSYTTLENTIIGWAEGHM